MALFHSRLLPAALLLASACAAHAQTQTVTVTGRTLPAAPSIAGFGDEPLARSPFAASMVDAAQLRDAGLQQLSGLTRLNASVGDAYNSEGYWSFLAVRGFTLDNRFNYRRDGLPINAETAIGLANKQRIEVLAGLSGIQAGTSAPGGLVNLVTKRPEGTVRGVVVEARQGGSLGSALDIGQRFGAGEAFGLRINAAYDHLDPQTHDLRGERGQFAAAADWRLAPGSLLEAEFETSRQSQPSVPGFSLLGNTVPDATTIDPRTNLNNQPWSLPVALRGDTASLRWQQRLDEVWRFTAHGMTQRLKNDDRIAFPFGCGAEGNFDRYCSDGTFDLYDFRSENERRTSDALDLSFAGKPLLGGLAHRVAAGVLFTRFESRLQRQAFNYAGTGNIDGTLETPPAPELTDENTNRDERSTELYLRDALRLGADWQLWAGVRHTRLHRESVRTDGLRATRYEQSATLPWLALSWQWRPSTMLYASWGQGLESDVAPNRPRYTNAGEALPALKSRQVEGGLKFDDGDLNASLVAFVITRPQAADIGACTDEDASCTRRTDGSARHRGLEASAGGRRGPWSWHGSAMWLDAERQGAGDPAINGLRPTNVPRNSLRLHTGYAMGAVPGLSLDAGLSHEGDRAVLPDNSARIPSWTRIDIGARYLQRTAAAQLTWRVNIDNLTDKRAWKESPFQFDHVYLYPMPPRSLRLSVQADL